MLINEPLTNYVIFNAFTEFFYLTYIRLVKNFKFIITKSGSIIINKSH